MIFEIPCSQTHSSSEMPPTIYSFASLKYDHARQTALCIQRNSIFLITGSTDQSVCKGLMQAVSPFLQTVGEQLLLFLHVKSLSDSNDEISEDHYMSIIVVLSFIEILSWARSFYFVFVFNLYD